MVSFLLPNFIFLNKTKFKKDEPNTDNAPIAIGAPVSPSIAVSAIELSGAVATTVMIPPRIIPITIGFELAEAINTWPIFNSVESTIGVAISPISLVRGAAITIMTIRSNPPGNFFSRNLTTNDIKYPAMNPGNMPRPEHVNPINTEYTGETPRAKGTRTAAATPPKLPLASPTFFKNSIFNIFPKNDEWNASTKKLAQAALASAPMAFIPCGAL